MTARRISFGIVFLLLFVTPYAQAPWWEFFHSSIILVLLWRAAFGPGALTRLGLGARPYGWLGVLFAFLAILAAAGWVQWRIATSAGLVHSWYAFPWNIDPLYQALNEELILGWLLLTWLVRRTRRPAVSAWLLAAFFALTHVAFYRFVSTLYHDWLTWQAVTSLFLVGLCRNYLILAAGHVGYAWALHGAWNVWFFGGVWSNERPLGEPELFNVFLGHQGVVAAAALAAVFAVLLVRVRGVSPALR